MLEGASYRAVTRADQAGSGSRGVGCSNRSCSSQTMRWLCKWLHDAMALSFYTTVTV